MIELLPKRQAGSLTKKTELLKRREGRRDIRGKEKKLKVSRGDVAHLVFYRGRAGLTVLLMMG